MAIARSTDEFSNCNFGPSYLKNRLLGFDMSSSVQIDAPAQRVWELVSQVSRWPDWATVCREVWDAPTGENDWVVGRRFGFRLRMAGRNVPFNVEVKAVQKGDGSAPTSTKFLTWDSKKFTITAVRKIAITPESDNISCQVTDSKHFSSPFLPIAAMYPRWLIKNMTESWLRDLKIEAEISR